MLFPLSPENFRPRTHLRPTNEDPAATNPGAVAQLLGLFKIPGSPSGIIKKTPPLFLRPNCQRYYLNL